jgi:hypothetical protein
MTTKCICAEFEALKKRMIEAKEKYWKRNDELIHTELVPEMIKKYPELTEAIILEIVSDDCGGEYTHEVQDAYEEICGKCCDEIQKEYGFFEVEHEEYYLKIIDFIGKFSVEYSWDNFELLDKEGLPCEDCPCGKELTPYKPIVWGAS